MTAVFCYCEQNSSSMVYTPLLLQEDQACINNHKKSKEVTNILPLSSLPHMMGLELIVLLIPFLYPLSVNIKCFRDDSFILSKPVHNQHFEVNSVRVPASIRHGHVGSLKVDYTD